MTTNVLVDTDVLLYKAGFRAEQETLWPDDIVTLHMDLDEGLRCFESIANAWIAPFGKDLDEVFFYASDPTSRYFRHRVDPNYKAKRRRRSKPIGYQALRDKVSQKHQLLWKEGLEADDLLGIAATADEDAVIVSIDKDMNTVPGAFWNAGRLEMKRTSLEEANHFHLVQTISGDPTDGYSGIKDLGPVGARKVLKGKRGPVAQWEAVVRAFEKAEMTEIDALRNARLAYILRDGDYVDGEVKLWTPTYVAAGVK